MLRRFRTIFLALALVGLATALPSQAQNASDISLVPVANAPFSGAIHIEHTIVRRNGSVLTLQSTRDIRRDSIGRVYEAFRPVTPTSHPGNSDIVRIHLYDPQTSIATALDVKSHTFVQEVIEHPPSADTPRNFVQISAADKSASQNDFMKEEDLGMSKIDGIPVRGVRTLQITPATTSKSGKEIVITDEYWYSADLHIYLMIKHNDPRSGTVTLTVGEITRAEPDPAWFQIPADYKSKY
jgi:hypothetical protein